MRSPGLAMMSMYSELLAMSLDEAERAAAVHGPAAGDEAERGGAGDPVSDEQRLLGELAEQRQHLPAGRAVLAREAQDATSRIVAEIRYDRALIELCRLRGIPCDPARFTRPSRERRRLEEALEAAGVDVHGDRTHQPHTESSDAASARGHEPPEGS